MLLTLRFGHVDRIIITRASSPQPMFQGSTHGRPVRRTVLTRGIPEFLGLSDADGPGTLVKQSCHIIRRAWLGRRFRVSIMSAEQDPILQSRAKGISEHWNSHGRSSHWSNCCILRKDRIVFMGCVARLKDRDIYCIKSHNVQELAYPHSYRILRQQTNIPFHPPNVECCAALTPRPTSRGK